MHTIYYLRTGNIKGNLTLQWKSIMKTKLTRKSLFNLLTIGHLAYSPLNIVKNIFKKGFIFKKELN